MKHKLIIVAMRTRALTLAVCSSSATNLEASVAGGAANDSAFIRDSGSFLTDGFEAGMEITVAGFATAANNTTFMITHISSNGLVMTVNGTLTAETSASGRTITVGLPSGFVTSNKKYKPVAGRTYATEVYIPGRTGQRTCSPYGMLEAEPMYGIRIHIPTNMGDMAMEDYHDALFALFAPRTAIVLSNGDTVRVRSDTGPFAGQTIPSPLGWSSRLVTFPLRLYTQNSI